MVAALGVGVACNGSNAGGPSPFIDTDVGVVDDTGSVQNDTGTTTRPPTDSGVDAHDASDSATATDSSTTLDSATTTDTGIDIGDASLTPIDTGVVEDAPDTTDPGCPPGGCFPPPDAGPDVVDLPEGDAVIGDVLDTAEQLPDTGL